MDQSATPLWVCDEFCGRAVDRYCSDFAVVVRDASDGDLVADVSDVGDDGGRRKIIDGIEQLRPRARF